ncbi:TraB/GumN family protein [Sphingomonas sp. AR_OL41]|uniref:TraB/GumN family protein n=1 Tax=Sphingomonas sp. AR_OL41 TaxID=3042729 RepID=UPI0024808C13|nr:TraB/GumN family protein [Sphingomonas sp. AR_OL41]MDH7971681.1 TraB/GumN family protein [Sphingomonas sp. AR_OL41]
MRTLLKVAVALAALATPLALAAQTAPAPAPAATAPAKAAPVTMVDADPALWVVKDKDTTIYLFGTIHVLKPGLSWFDEAVKKAFDKSDTLVLELVMPDPAAMQALVMKTGFTTSGPTLTEKLPEPDRTAYVKALTDLGIPPAALDRAKPWTAAINLSLIPVLKLGYDPNQGPEHVLTEAAAAEHKPVIGLETAEQQFSYFDTLPEPLQLKFLEMTVRDLPKTGTEINSMVESWSKGDPEALGRTLNEGMSEQPEIGKVLLSDRNARWATWIAERLKTPGTVFIAVGAGHLAGDQSVQAWLGKHHLKAERIPY